jgi:rod shape-determining protein MreD
VNNSLSRYAVVFLIAFVLQVSVVPYFEIVHWKPDLVLIVLVMFAIRHGRKHASTAGFLTGVLSDIISGGLLGLGALSRTITGYAAGWLALFFQEKGQFIFTLFLSGVIQDGIYFYINTLGRQVLWRVIIFVHIIPNLFYTAMVGSVIYYFLSRWLNEDD